MPGCRSSQSVVCAFLIGFFSLGLWEAHAGAAPAEESLRDRFSAFEEAAGIQEWPRLQGCGYVSSFSGSIVGVVLQVESSNSAQARWSRWCHVAARHKLLGWPERLGPGAYVVAVTSEPERPGDKRNRLLQVLSVFGSEPDCVECIRLAIDRICAGGTEDRNNDDQACGKR